MSNTNLSPGSIVPHWSPRQRPMRESLVGGWCTLEPLDPQCHAVQLHDAFARDVSGAGWTYLSYGPFADAEAYAAWMRANAQNADPQFFAVIERISGFALGIVSYLRIEPAHGTIEIGHIHWSLAMRQTPAATEAIFLLLDHAFGLGYRRVEWKCDALNAPSRAAAARFGFQFEGVFRQHMIVKGRNRDTAWFAILDHEWPALRASYVRWLAADNFDAQGRQIMRLMNSAVQSA